MSVQHSAVIDEIARELHADGDLLKLQLRCAAIAPALADDEQSRKIIEWVATQAELIDCGLVLGSRQALEQALLDLRDRMEGRVPPH
jgi:hypothetical protein